MADSPGGMRSTPGARPAGSPLTLIIPPVGREDIRMKPRAAASGGGSATAAEAGGSLTGPAPAPGATLVVSGPTLGRMMTTTKSAAPTRVTAAAAASTLVATPA